MKATRRADDDGGMLGLWIIVGVIVAFLTGGWYWVGPGAASSVRRDRPITLVLACPADRATLRSFQGVVDAYEANHPRVRVELRPIAGANYSQKLLVMAASGLPPDLMWIGSGFVEFASRGAFLDITDRVATDDLTRGVPERYLEWCRIGGRQYAVPYLIDVQFILYNKALFDKAGVPYPAVDWNFNDFISAAQTLTLDRNDDGLIDQYGFRGRLEMCLFDAEIVSENGATPTVNTANMADYLQTNIDLHNRWNVAPSMQQLWAQGIDQYTAFRQGRAAMMVMFTWDLPYLRQHCADMDWGIALNPKVRRRGQWSSFSTVGISSETEHPEAAWALYRMFYEPPYQRTVATGGLPANLDVVRALAESDEPELDHLPTMIAAAETLCPMPRVAGYSQLNEYFMSACESIWMGQSSVPDALARAETNMRRALDRRRETGQ